MIRDVGDVQIAAGVEFDAVRLIQLRVDGRPVVAGEAGLPEPATVETTPVSPST